MAVVNQLQQFGETPRPAGRQDFSRLPTRLQRVLVSSRHAVHSFRRRRRGPGEAAGIEAGDVIIKFDGKDIKEMRDLPRIVADTTVGKGV